MTWLMLVLGGAAGLFYGLWQRSRAARFKAERDEAREALASLDARWADDVLRLNRVITGLKAEITRLEAASLANATPDELRARLAAVLRPHP